MKTTTALAFFSLVLACATAARADTFGSGVNTFDIDFVTIGNPGNPPDVTGNPNPAGSISYRYRMGKYEISEDMINKANVLGLLGITLADMSSYGGNAADRPATGVSWFEAAKFVNWLNTSTGSTPAYKFDASGNFQLWTPSDSGYNSTNPYRNSHARYFLPSVHEWYKAAYYDPNVGVYYDYPTGSDMAPIPVASGTTAGTAVYDQYFSIGPADITLAGGLSPYGTMGQGGNVYEWEETDFDLVNDSHPFFSFRGVRGGSWAVLANGLPASSRTNDLPTGFSDDLGFRVASVIPEPSSLQLGSLAVAVAGLLRRATKSRVPTTC